MSPSSPPSGLRITAVKVTAAEIRVELDDGRTISVPLAWYPRLMNASEQDRQDWRLARAGFGIHWPTLDVDLSVEGLLLGASVHPLVPGVDADSGMTKIDSDAIHRLSIPDRVRLVQEIWDSLRPTAEDLPLTPEQAKVLDDRLEQHRRDPSAALPWEDVKARLRAR